MPAASYGMWGKKVVLFIWVVYTKPASIYCDNKDLQSAYESNGMCDSVP